jgi:hypothetical protein
MVILFSMDSIEKIITVTSTRLTSECFFTIVQSTALVTGLSFDLHEMLVNYRKHNHWSQTYIQIIEYPHILFLQKFLFSSFST